MWDDLCDLTVLLREKTIHPREALAESRARLERVNRFLNVVAVPMWEKACARAEMPFNGPFHGAPFLLKDSVTAAFNGTAQPLGSSALAADISGRNSFLSEKMASAGLNPFAKTTTSEFSVLIDTFSSLNGTTHNPWDLAKSPGGSSGGSAAAVAAGIVPAAHASDGAGSIRLPASFCGLVGMKPTRGRISLGPSIGETLNGTACEGVVSVSVRDTAMLLDALSGARHGDPYSAPALPEPLLQTMERPRKRLRIGLITASPFGDEVSEDAREAATRASLLCEQLGHEVFETRLPIDGSELTPKYKQFYSMSCNRTINALLQTFDSSTLFSKLDAFQIFLWERYSAMPALQLLEILNYFNRVTRSVAAWMEEMRCDAWLSPTTASTAFDIGYLDAARFGGDCVFDRFLRVNPFAPIANITGAPAISVPLHWTSSNHPLGVQLVGRQNDEGLLLSMARQLELARPWKNRLPAVSALYRAQLS